MKSDSSIRVRDDELEKWGRGLQNVAPGRNVDLTQVDENAREAKRMASVVGVLVILGAGAVLWLLLPRNGKTHPLATAPYLEVIIPVVLVASIPVGVALIAHGLR